jgi:hypothetical protein
MLQMLGWILMAWPQAAYGSSQSGSSAASPNNANSNINGNNSAHQLPNFGPSSASPAAYQPDDYSPWQGGPNSYGYYSPMSGNGNNSNNSPQYPYGQWQPSMQPPDWDAYNHWMQAQSQQPQYALSSYFQSASPGYTGPSVPFSYNPVYGWTQPYGSPNQSPQNPRPPAQSPQNQSPQGSQSYQSPSNGQNPSSNNQSQAQPGSSPNSLPSTSPWSTCPKNCNGVENPEAFRNVRRSWWRCSEGSLLQCYVHVIRRMLEASQSKVCRCNQCHFPAFPEVRNRLQHYLSTVEYNQQNQQLVQAVAGCVQPIFGANMEALSNRLLQAAYACQIDVRALEDLEHMVMMDLGSYVRCLASAPAPPAQ